MPITPALRHSPRYLPLIQRLHRYAHQQPTTWEQLQQRAELELRALEEEGIEDTEQEGYVLIRATAHNTEIHEWLQTPLYAMWLAQVPDWPDTIQRRIVFECLKLPV